MIDNDWLLDPEPDMAERDDCDFYHDGCTRERTIYDVIDEMADKPLAEALTDVRAYADAPLDILNGGLSYSEQLEYGYIDEGQHITPADELTDTEWQQRHTEARIAEREIKKAARKGRGWDPKRVKKAIYDAFIKPIESIPTPTAQRDRAQAITRTRSHSRTRRTTRSASSVSRGSPSDDSDPDPEPPEPQAHSPPFSCPPLPSDTSTARGLIVAYLSPTRRRAQTVGRAMLGRPHGARANDKGGKPTMKLKNSIKLEDMMNFDYFMLAHDKSMMDAAEVKKHAREILDAAGGDLLGAIVLYADRLLHHQAEGICEHGQDVTFVGTFGGEFHVAALRDRLQAAADIIEFDRMGLMLIRELCDMARR